MLLSLVAAAELQWITGQVMESIPGSGGGAARHADDRVLWAARACPWGLANGPVGGCRGPAGSVHRNGHVSIPPETRYARNGAIHLAYQVLGSGPPNLLVVQSAPNSHVDPNSMEPSLARSLHRLASFSRLILCDNRGAGLSDPASGSAASAMDEQVDDIRDHGRNRLPAGRACGPPGRGPAWALVMSGYRHPDMGPFPGISPGSNQAAWASS